MRPPTDDNYFLNITKDKRNNSGQTLDYPVAGYSIALCVSDFNIFGGLDSLATHRA